MVASFLGLQLQYTDAASIEVPKYEVDELNLESGLVVSGTQFIEYPDGQTKIEVPSSFARLSRVWVRDNILNAINKASSGLNTLVYNLGIAVCIGKRLRVLSIFSNRLSGALGVNTMTIHGFDLAMYLSLTTLASCSCPMGKKSASSNRIKDTSGKPRIASR